MLHQDRPRTRRSHPVLASRAGLRNRQPFIRPPRGSSAVTRTRKVRTGLPAGTNVVTGRTYLGRSAVRPPPSEPAYRALISGGSTGVGGMDDEVPEQFV